MQEQYHPATIPQLLLNFWVLPMNNPGPLLTPAPPGSDPLALNRCQIHTPFDVLSSVVVVAVVAVVVVNWL